VGRYSYSSRLMNQADGLFDIQFCRYRRGYVETEKVTVQGGDFYSGDNEDVTGFQFEGALDGVVVCDCNSIQSPLLGVGDNLLEGNRRVAGIAGVNVKVDFQSQNFPFITPNLKLLYSPHFFQLGLKLLFGIHYFAEERLCLVYLVVG